MNGGMSAIGTKRTSLVALHMSAFGGKADITLTSANVRDPKTSYNARMFHSRVAPQHQI